MDALVKPGRLAQWGNSSAVRLATDTLERARFAPNEEIDVVAGDREIILRPRRPRVTLDALLARFDPQQHRHPLMLDAAPVGRETL